MTYAPPLDIVDTAASLTTASKSAPTYPTLNLPICNQSMSDAQCTFDAKFFNISVLCDSFGGSIATSRSNLPGLRNPESRDSGRLVAPITTWLRGSIDERRVRRVDVTPRTCEEMAELALEAAMAS